MLVCGRFKARDGLATAMHGMWGAFWIAYGILQVILASGRVTLPERSGFTEFGYYFVVLAAITWAGDGSALSRRDLTAVYGLLAAGSTLAALGFLGGVEGLVILAGYVFLISAVTAFGVASSRLLRESRESERQAPPAGEVGVVRGQA